MYTKWPCMENGVPCSLRQPGCQGKCLKMLVAQLEKHEGDRLERKNKMADVNASGVRVASSIAKSRRKRRQI